MTKDELRKALSDFLAGDVDKEAVLLLQDASIHAAAKIGMDLTDAMTGYGVLAVGHVFFKEVLGVDLAKMDVLESNANTEFFEQQKPEEKEKLNSLLRDINLDL